MQQSVGAPSAQDILTLVDRIINDGYQLTPEDGRSLLDTEPGSEAFRALLAGSQRIRQHFVGNKVHCCSILNAKAGGCSENCSYCAQASGSSNMDYDKHRWLDDGDIEAAARSAKANGAGALGLVAARRGDKEGKQLDMVCESVEELIQTGSIRPDVNLGILETQTCADRLKQAGVKVYGHNLETAKSFFDETCTTHDFEERLKTIQYIKKSGMGLCSGGIIGMGENKEQRIEFAEQLRFIDPDMIPINFLNPLQGTGLADRPTVDPDEALITLAVYRFYLPEKNIMVAGGKEITFGERLHEVLGAGINSVMVGNYLTTLGTDPEAWQQMIADYGLEAHSHEDVAEGPCSTCGKS
jgi:biotin synthase